MLRGGPSVGLVSQINTDAMPTKASTMTVMQLCNHFELRELSKDNAWRSHATKKIYEALEGSRDEQ